MICGVISSMAFVKHTQSEGHKVVSDNHKPTVDEKAMERMLREIESLHKDAQKKK